MAGHPLTAKSQGKNDKRQKPPDRVDRHRETGQRQKAQNNRPKATHSEPVSQPPGPNHKPSRCPGAKRVTPTPVAVRQTKPFANFTRKNRDKKGLAKTAEKGQQNPGR